MKAKEAVAKNRKSASKKEVARQVAFSSGVPQRKVSRVGRNEECPCQSGLKYKNCHEAEGEAFLQKLAAQRERERLLEEQKKAGVPWYKRLLTSVSK